MIKKIIVKNMSPKRKGKHLTERRKRGFAGLIFPDMFCKHMAIDRKTQAV